MPKIVNILAISGSLRALSSNTALLLAAAELAPPHVRIRLLQGLHELPMFNPDLDGREPESVMRLRVQLCDAHAFLIASPEYAHGVSGPLKNALDWVVGSGEFTNKPTALLNASHRAVQGYSALKATLSVMGAQLVPAASLTVPLARNTINTRQILDTPEYANVIHLATRELVAATLAGQE